MVINKISAKDLMENLDLEFLAAFRTHFTAKVICFFSVIGIGIP